jgi:hypothetical protein
VALRLAQDGADIAIIYARSPDNARAVVEWMSASGRAIAIAAANANATRVEEAVRETVRVFGKIDILVKYPKPFACEGSNLFKTFAAIAKTAAAKVTVAGRESMQ